MNFDFGELKKSRAEELEFLTKKGAFILPPRPFQLALVRSYINYIHPRVPFVNIGELLHTISAETQAQDISILLLQAIFFAGSVFTTPADLSAAGYKSKSAVCGELFARARCLFDLDYEQDRLIVIKSLVLLSFRKEKDTDKDPRHWMNIAVSLAYTAGLHRFPDPRVSVGMQRDRARTWWSLFCLDRFLSLSMKRAGIIDDEAFETPILTMSDFEFPSYTPGEVDALNTSEIMQDVEVQKRLALIFIENTKLSLCVSRVLNALEFPRGLCAGPFMETPATSRSSEGFGTLSNFYCIQELETWVANLPATITELPLFYTLSSEANKVLRSHYCALRTLHLAASTLIYRSLEAQ
ncbi:C6 transcription factor (Ctf1B) [Penicillium paradoxum]|uniref:C6 transcription factor (Ctf1B) n=1 Tax=Penicillium paradoxum TaxID=176176 RepID=UPI0025476059|nr:C6 transcription factor (Ctf1B) [Penicillium paradoxum]KAJ5773314.1 C6 transcription factor (Ctf1B) [Penicillium paradoxum]